MEKRRLYDGPVKLTGRKVTADRTAEYDKMMDYRRGGWVLTYESRGNSGSSLDVHTLVYELMIIAGYDVLQVSSVVYGGEFTASELAGKVGYLSEVMDNCNPEWEDYKRIRIKTKTFCCSFDTRLMFEQMAEWEGVAGITSKKAYRFHCDGKEIPNGMTLKPYQRCHGYKPTTISLVAEDTRIAKKFEVLGKLYRSLTSEGMRKAMSVVAAARLFDDKSYEVKALIKTAMRWKLWKDYARPDAAAEYSLPISFSASDLQCGPECYKQVDSKYVQELVNHWNKMVADSPMPEWPKQGDWVMFKNRDVWGKKKYQGKFFCEGMRASLSLYGDRIEWRASVRVKKYDNEYFLPGQLEPWVDQKKAASKRGKNGAGSNSSEREQARPKVKTKAKTKAKKPAAVKVQGSDYTVKSDGRTETFGSYIPKSLAETQPSDIKPQTSTMDIAERLRQVLLAKLAA